MLPGIYSPLGKVAYGALAAAVIALAAWRIAVSTRGGDERIVYPVVCAKCGFEEPRELPAGGGDVPVECPKCKAKAVWLAYECPFCRKALPYNPQSPPKTCKYCGKEVPD